MCFELSGGWSPLLAMRKVKGVGLCWRCLGDGNKETRWTEGMFTDEAPVEGGAS